MQVFRSIIQEKKSSFNADLSLKYTPHEAIGQLESTDSKPSCKNDFPCLSNAQGTFRFTYSKNESYKRLLLYSSKKVRPNI